MTRRFVIVGAGIVGTALAAELSAYPGISVTVIDQGPSERLIGSSGHAPGYIGILDEHPVLTNLARLTTEIYEGLAFGGLNGFSRVGAIEVALTLPAMKLLEHRHLRATVAGLPAHLLSGQRAAELAPDLIEPEPVLGALHLPGDGTARASVLASAFRLRAEEAGTRFVDANEVTTIEIAGRRVTGVRTIAESFPADDVVIATGIWSPILAASIGMDLPLIPVAHPYVYGPPLPRRPGTKIGPFVRWPEQLVYARNHGRKFGIGTYDHTLQPVPPKSLHQRAERDWDGPILDDAISRAIGLLPESSRFDPDLRLNGIFAMTPDNLPLLGSVAGVEGAWIASAIWVTHAAGSARLLAETMLGTRASIAEANLFDPGRFDGHDAADLERRALSLYNEVPTPNP